MTSTCVTVAEALDHGASRLLSIADNPRREARLLLAYALGVAQTDLIRDPSAHIEPTHYDHLLARREAHEPIALILGRQEFWSLEFRVSTATLIPRADSETLVEAAISLFAGRPPPDRILDLGTGTGCLLLALLTEFPRAFGIGIDINPAAVGLAQDNARQLGLIDRSAFASGSWTNAIDGTFDLIVSNPPYVAEPDIAALMPEVARFEPRTALNGGPDGYDAYRAILPRLRETLTPAGAAILEVGAGQADVVIAMARQSGFQAEIRLDLAEFARAVILTQPF
jgi:release factor glutamine methyltransferase